MDHIQCYGVLLSKNIVLKDEVRFINDALDKFSPSERGFLLLSVQTNFIRPNYFLGKSMESFQIVICPKKSQHSKICFLKILSYFFLPLTIILFKVKMQYCFK